MPPQTDALCACPLVEPPRSAQGALTPHRFSPRRTSHQQPAGVAIRRASSTDGFSPGDQCCIWAQEHAQWIRWTAYMSDDRLEPTNARSWVADRPPPWSIGSPGRQRHAYCCISDSSHPSSCAPLDRARFCGPELDCPSTRVQVGDRRGSTPPAARDSGPAAAVEPRGRGVPCSHPVTQPSSQAQREMD